MNVCKPENFSYGTRNSSSNISSNMQKKCWIKCWIVLLRPKQKKKKSFWMKKTRVGWKFDREQIFHPTSLSSSNTTFMFTPCFIQHFILMMSSWMFELQILNNQRQPLEVFCKKRRSKKIRKLHSKTSVLESLFNKAGERKAFLL